MATQVWSDDGARQSLDLYLRTAGKGLDGYKVALFNTSLVLDHNTTIAALLAAECNFPGYARLSLSYANWPASTVTAHVAASTYSQQLTWTCTGGGSSQQAYGWFILDAAGTVWIASDKFASGPYTMLASGDNIAGTLTLTAQSHN